MHDSQSRLLAFAIMVAVFMLPSCSAGKAKNFAEQGVTKFHAQLDAEQYHDIYSLASTEFRNSDSETNLTEFLAAVHRKLGNVQNSKEETFFINYGTAGTTVTLTYKTDFKNGPANEQFVWRVGDEAILVGYRVDSRVLVTK